MSASIRGLLTGDGNGNWLLVQDRLFAEQDFQWHRELMGDGNQTTDRKVVIAVFDFGNLTLRYTE
jgi:hypothetical protein